MATRQKASQAPANAKRVGKSVQEICNLMDGPGRLNEDQMERALNVLSLGKRRLSEPLLSPDTAANLAACLEKLTISLAIMASK